MQNKELLDIMERCGHFLYHRKGGKRGQRKIMSIVYEREKISQKELSELVNIRSGSLSEFVIKLEDKGYILRERAPEDKRQFIISLSPSGRDYYENKIHEMAQQNEILFEALSEEEQKSLEGLLTKLFGYWEVTFAAECFGAKHRKEGER